MRRFVARIKCQSSTIWHVISNGNGLSFIQLLDPVSRGKNEGEKEKGKKKLTCIGNGCEIRLGTRGRNTNAEPEFEVIKNWCKAGKVILLLEMIVSRMHQKKYLN